MSESLCLCCVIRDQKITGERHIPRESSLYTSSALALVQMVAGDLEDDECGHVLPMLGGDGHSVSLFDKMVNDVLTSTPMPPLTDGGADAGEGEECPEVSSVYLY